MSWLGRGVGRAVTAPRLPELMPSKSGTSRSICMVRVLEQVLVQGETLAPWSDGQSRNVALARLDK